MIVSPTLGLFEWFYNLSEKLSKVIKAVDGIFNLISDFAKDSLEVFNSLVNIVKNLPFLFGVCIPAPLLILVGTFITVAVVFRVLGND